MVLWIVLALVVLSLLMLALAVRSLVRDLGSLRRAAVALRRRQSETEALQAGAAELRDRLEGLASRVGAAQRRVEMIKARKGRVTDRASG